MFVGKPRTVVRSVCTFCFSANYFLYNYNVRAIIFLSSPERAPSDQLLWDCFCFPLVFMSSWCPCGWASSYLLWMTHLLSINTPHSNESPSSVCLLQVSDFSALSQLEEGNRMGLDCCCIILFGCNGHYGSLTPPPSLSLRPCCFSL